MDKLLLCTDMDRTIIPNGHQPEHPRAREMFHQLCNLPEIRLVYVTGRDLVLTREAIEAYQLPMPAFTITDVGTKIYQQKAGGWRELVAWQEEIAADWGGKSHAELKNALAGLEELTLQESSKQNDFKLSYYVGLDIDQRDLLARVHQRFRKLGVHASLIWSIDEPQGVGLLDVLPQNATKMHGIEFLGKFLGYSTDEILFAGDSGNDLLVMGSSIRSILVANADEDTKERAFALAEDNGVLETLYLAKEGDFPLGGNYSAGVLQGVAHFAPNVVGSLRL